MQANMDGVDRHDRTDQIRVGRETTRGEET